MVVGEDGILAFTAGALISVTTQNPAYGGTDSITVGNGTDIVIGGTGSDTILAGNGNNIIIGDDGSVVFASPGVLQTIQTSDPTDGGNDQITAGWGNNFILGGVGNNTITAGYGNDVVVGHDGEMSFYAATTTVGSQAWLSQGAGVTDGPIWNLYQGWYTETFTGGLLGYVTSLDPTFGGTGAITLGNGTDLVIGGTGNKTISLGNGSDIVVGDNGNVTFSALGVLTTIELSDPTDGGNSQITVGFGNNFIIGGVGSNTITAGVWNHRSYGILGGTDGFDHGFGTWGNNVIIGNDGVIDFSTSIWDWVNPTWFTEYGAPVLSVTSTDFGYFGNNTITGGPNNTVVIGGGGSNSITVTDGTDVVIGNDGQVTYSVGGAFSVIQTTDPTYGGNNSISAGDGNDYILGGAGSSTPTSADGNAIGAGNGDDAIIGTNGAMYFTSWSPRPYDDPRWFSFNESMLYYMTTADPSVGGNNDINTGGGQNVIIGGGPGSNSIVAGDGGNTIIGANGNVSFLAPGVDGTVETSDPTYAGNNTIYSGNGDDRILGGVGNNTITDGDGNNVIFGADGVLTFTDDNIEGDSTLLAFSGRTYLRQDGWTVYSDGLLVSAVSTDTNLGGTDTIMTGNGQNLIVGGFGSANITAGEGQNIIIGGNGEANFAGAGQLDLVESVAPVPTTASNVIAAGDGTNIIIGGLGTNTITSGNGENIVFGADGEVTFTNFVRTQTEGEYWDTVEDTVYAEAQSIYPTLGGNDTISLGTGNDVVFGGAGNDTITLASAVTGDELTDYDSYDGGRFYVVFGGDGTVMFSTGGWVTSARLTFPQFTGTDSITIGSNPTLVLQGQNDEVRSNLSSPVPQMASGPAPTGEDTSPGLTESELQPVVVEAETIWARVLGPDNARLAILNGITVQVGDLPNNLIGGTIGDTIYIDSSADGWGWFIDPTGGNSDFSATSLPGVLTAIPGSAAAGHMDLLSTVLHEMGNAMGFPEDSGQDVTGNVLDPGERRLPVLEGAVAAAVPLIAWGAINNTAGITPLASDTDGSNWVDNFVNNYGNDGKYHRPNASLRIKLPGS